MPSMLARLRHRRTAGGGMWPSPVAGRGSPASLPIQWRPMTPPAGGDYSATPLRRKLGIREGSRVLLVTPPPRFELGPLPAGARLVRGARGPLDVVLLFCTTHRDLRRRFGKLA